MRQTIRVWVEDKHGSLLRVAGIISAKGANIHTLNLTPDPSQEGISIITISSDLEPRLHQRVINEMNRLVNVFLAEDVTVNAIEALRDAQIREAYCAKPGSAQPMESRTLVQEQAC